MGVIDERVRHEGMQQQFQRRAGRHRIEQIGALHARHVLVGKFVAAAQLAQRRKPHRHHAGRLDGRHVGAGALDAQHLDLVACEVAHPRLHRGVAAAVQHELAIAAEQSRAVDAQRQLRRNAACGIAVDRRLGVTIDPAALHQASPCRRPAGAWPTTRCAAACWRRRLPPSSTRSGPASAPVAAQASASPPVRFYR